MTAHLSVNLQSNTKYLKKQNKKANITHNSGGGGKRSERIYDETSFLFANAFISSVFFLVLYTHPSF